jgi:hypothetical protein
MERFKTAVILILFLLALGLAGAADYDDARTVERRAVTR